MTREGSAARNPPGNDVPRVIGTSPKMSPGRRWPSLLDSFDRLDDLDPTVQDGEQRPLVTLVHGVLARDEMNVCRDPRQPLALDRGQGREQRNRRDLLRGHQPA